MSICRVFSVGMEIKGGMLGLEKKNDVPKHDIYYCLTCAYMHNNEHMKNQQGWKCVTCYWSVQCGADICSCMLGTKVKLKMDGSKCNFCLPWKFLRQCRKIISRTYYLVHLMGLQGSMVALFINRRVIKRLVLQLVVSSQVWNKTRGHTWQGPIRLITQHCASDC